MKLLTSLVIGLLISMSVYAQSEQTKLEVYRENVEQMNLVEKSGQLLGQIVFLIWYCGFSSAETIISASLNTIPIISMLSHTVTSSITMGTTREHIKEYLASETHTGALVSGGLLSGLADITAMTYNWIDRAQVISPNYMIKWRYLGEAYKSTKIVALNSFHQKSGCVQTWNKMGIVLDVH